MYFGFGRAEKRTTLFVMGLWIHLHLTLEPRTTNRAKRHHFANLSATCRGFEPEPIDYSFTKYRNRFILRLIVELIPIKTACEDLTLAARALELNTARRPAMPAMIAIPPAHIYLHIYIYVYEKKVVILKNTYNIYMHTSEV